MSAVRDDPREALRRVLLPPLHFAAKNDFAGLERLKGLPALFAKALSNTPGLDEATRVELEKVANGFDEAPLDERRQRVARALSLLDESAPAVPEKPRAKPPGDQGRTSHNAATPPRRTPRSGVAALRENAAATNTLQDVLSLDVTALKGIGPQKAAQLYERGLSTLNDVLLVIPRAWEDRRGARDLGSLEPGAVAVVSGDILASGQVGGGRGKRWEVLLDDGRGRVKLVFFRFNAFQMKQRYPPGATVTATGEVARRGGILQMVHPRVVLGAQTGALSGIWPVYPEIGGLHPAELARTAKAALDRVMAAAPTDPLPEDIRRAAKVIDLQEALYELHSPKEELSAAELKALVERTAPAFRRLAFEELFALQLAMALRRRAGASEPAAAVPGSEPDALAAELLPFSLTNAQRRATTEIFRDLEREEPMARLLQGDVGAGKTAVAALALLRVARANLQAVMMAPTELLAEQHRRTLERWFTPLGIRVEGITGSMRGKARREAVARLASGRSSIAVGTHALLSEDVEFRRLALAIIDEQHRFGVEQRVGLKAKGFVPEDAPEEQRPLVPHLLVMTATPIPRSLALTLYGDLAVSVLDELPPGRQPVTTKVLDGRAKVRAVEAIEAALARGERAYVVYPLIEESEKLDLKDATRGYEELSKRFGKERVALVHGRMPAEERDATMQAFARGDVQVLVSTTVIEVGVDVPEASCMVVANAERFGLSQLHQLRGRVGRGAARSECWLLAGSGGEDARRRLLVMEESNDGFRIAEEDLAIRGPGDFLGTRQSGLPTLLFSDFARHAALLELARELAWSVTERDPTLSLEENRGLKELVQRRFADRIALTGAG